MNTVRAIKSTNGEWILDVLGVPFGGPFNGRDHDGEYFDAKTDLWLDRIPTRPIVYFHGIGDDSPEVIGQELSHTVKADGVWFRVKLDQTSALARRVWEAALKGLARASSGAINHLVRPQKRRPDGYIEVWPVGELSLLDMVEGRAPVNPYAIALPAAKATYIKAGIDLPVDLETEVEPDGERASDQSPNGSESGKETTKAQKENKPMSDDMLTNDDVARIAAETMRQVLDERDVQQKAEREAQAALEAETQRRIDEAVKAKQEELEAKLKAQNRLPWADGVPSVGKFGELRQYDNMSARDLAFAISALQGTELEHHLGENALKAFSIKACEEDSPMADQVRYTMKAQGLPFDGNTIKASEIDYTTQTGYGKEWVGTYYAGDLWRAIRHPNRIASLLPTRDVPQGSSTMIIRLEGADPTVYKVPEATGDAATGGLSRPAPTVTSSKLATANKTVTLAKMGARVRYSKEEVEDSLENFATQLSNQLELVVAETFEHVLIDGDTASTASTNINAIGGAVTTNAAYLLTNGFRKYALTYAARSGAALDEDDFLETAKKLGVAGKGADPAQTIFIIDPNVYWKGFTEIAAIKTKDVFSSPTIESGVWNQIWGYPIYRSYNMHWVTKGYTSYAYKANASGKCDTTTSSNNTTGTILAVRPDQWVLGMKRRMEMNTKYEQDWDGFETVVFTRFGLAYRDTTGAAAAISYNLTV